jgi:hypothetical protein
MGIFSYFYRLDRNTQLMWQLFSRLGIDDWFARSPRGAEVLRRAALRCGSCTHDAECAAWLETHATADRAPAFCRNRHLAERIAHDIGVDA